MATVALSNENPAELVEVCTSWGTFLVSLSLSPKDGALVVSVDTDDLNPTPERLRLNVNDGPVWNYADATRWYGEDVGYPAPTL